MATVDGAAFATPREPQRDTALALLLAGLSIAAWLALWSWSASPYARYAAHDGWLDATAFAALCRALPGGTLVVPAALYALAWVLMIAAMMLPTTYPVLGIFRVMTRSRADARRLARRPQSVARRARLDRGRRRARGRGAVPVQRAEVPLPRPVPDAVRLRHLALARPLTRARGVRDRPRSRRLLRRLLLGADALHVRRRHRQPGLDARARGADGDGEERRGRSAAADADRRRTARRGGHRPRRAPLTED